MSPQLYEVDIHGMTVDEASILLEDLLIDLPETIKELVIIHGYKSGHRLKDYIRKELKHERIKRRMVSMNPGITSLILY